MLPNMAGKERAHITVQGPGERQHAIHRPGIEMLPAMPGMPGLLRTKAEQASGMQIGITFMDIGIGVMQNVGLRSPRRPLAAAQPHPTTCLLACHDIAISNEDL